MQYEENDGAEDNDINIVNHHDLVVDNVEAVTYFAEGNDILNRYLTLDTIQDFLNA